METSLPLRHESLNGALRIIYRLRVPRGYACMEYNRTFLRISAKFMCGMDYIATSVAILTTRK
jgi:hypothetical protein